MPGPIVRPQGFTSYPAFIPKLNASNPLTKGLVDAMLPVGSVVARITGDGRQTVLARNGTLTNAYDSVIGFGRKTPANSTTDFDTSSTSAAMPAGFGTGASCLKECSLLVLTRVGSTTTASTFLAGYGSTTSTTPIFGFQLGAANSQWVFYVRDNSSGGQQVTGTLAGTVVDKAFCLLGTRSESANYHRMYVNGAVDVNTTASATSTATYDNATFNTVRRSGALATVGGVNALVLVWNRALTPAEARSISDNPWQVFEVPSRPIFADVVSGGTVTAVGASSGVATAQATSAATSAQVAASAGVATAQATGASTSAQVASAAGTVLTADFIGASTSAQVGSSSGSVTIADFINGTATLVTAIGEAAGTSTVLGISQAVDTDRSKGGWDPYYFKRRNKRRDKEEDVQEFVTEVLSAPAPDIAEQAKIAALQYLAIRNTALQAEKAAALSSALNEINAFYSQVRAELKRRQELEDEEDDDILLLS